MDHSARRRTSLVLVLAFIACGWPRAVLAVEQNFENAVPNQLIVGWSPPVPVPRPRDPRESHARFEDANQIIEREGFVRVDILADGSAWLVETDLDLTPRALEDRANALTDYEPVTYASPNNFFQIAQTPSDLGDPDYPANQWSLERIDVEGAWAITTGSKQIVVGVMDTGLQTNHPDLVANLWVNPCEDLNHNGKIDDGSEKNGMDDRCPGREADPEWKDDFHGWNVVANNNVLYEQSGSSDAGRHGTEIAGVIAATRNNTIGIAGIADVRISGIRVSEGTVVLTWALAKGIQYALANGFDIVNFSGYGPNSDNLVDQVDKANDAGLIIVTAAGNDGDDIDNTQSEAFPAKLTNPNVIAVAATRKLIPEKLLTDSNYGAKSIDLAAPGEKVRTTTIDKTYGDAEKTSIATPHVTGVVALIKSIDESVTVDEIRECLKQGDPVPDLASKTAWGVRLDAAKAVTACKPVTENKGPVTEPDTHPCLCDFFGFCD